MLDRRQFIHRICDVLLVVGAALTGCSRAVTRQAAHSQEHILRDIEALQAWDYSEVGVSMIFACENLGDEQPLAANPADGHVHEAFTHYADMFLEQRPDASEDDVAAIVELVAHKDFQAGGKEFPL